MKVPPPYPRIPYLWPAKVTDTSDRVVPVAERGAWLQRPVVVEEKLDGANVSVWLHEGRIQVASRGGPGAMDRGGQLGPLRARVGVQYEVLLPLLDRGIVLYCEWLWLSHTVYYELLPDYLCVLDVLRPASGFVALTERAELCRQAGLVEPPRLFSGVLHTADTLLGLIGPSAFGSALMEGVVLRRDDGLVCKVVRPDFVRSGDSRIGRRRNRLVEV